MSSPPLLFECDRIAAMAARKTSPRSQAGPALIYVLPPGRAFVYLTKLTGVHGA